jgi:hypothetical protein
VPTLREPHRLEIHDLEVHHRIYERLGNEVLSYPVVLCRSSTSTTTASCQKPLSAQPP